MKEYKKPLIEVMATASDVICTSLHDVVINDRDDWNSIFDL